MPSITLIASSRPPPLPVLFDLNWQGWIKCFVWTVPERVIFKDAPVLWNIDPRSRRTLWLGIAPAKSTPYLFALGSPDDLQFYASRTGNLSSKRFGAFEGIRGTSLIRQSSPVGYEKEERGGSERDPPFALSPFRRVRPLARRAASPRAVGRPRGTAQT